jgi:hypothetical protein
MKLDDLKQAWQEEVKVLDNKPELAQALEGLETQTNKIDREVRFRDYVEISIAMIIIPVMVWRLYTAHNVVEFIGLLILLLACIYVPYKLLSAKKVKSSKLNSVKSFLTVEKQKIEAQIKLLSTIASWYLAPLSVGILLGFTGAQAEEVSQIVFTSDMFMYYGAVIGLSVLVYFYNKQTVAKKLQPVLDNLNARLNELPAESE